MNRPVNELGRYFAGLATCRKILMVVMLVATQSALSAWHDQQPGAGVAVHYVHLSGWGGDNEVNRRNLLISYKACTETQAAFGRPYEALPAQGLPATVSTQDIEIYYSTNRTLTIKQGILHSIKSTTCALVATPHRIVELRSSAGRCDMDLLKSEAVGNCDAMAHAQAAAWTGARQAVTSVSGIDMNKVPPQMRAQVQVQLDRMAKRDAPASIDGSIEPIETREVANIVCTVHRNRAVMSELCVANPMPTALNLFTPYPIPPAPLNGGIPGILIAAKTPALTLVAQEVRWNISVSPSLFNIPRNVRVRTMQGSPQ